MKSKTLFINILYDTWKKQIGTFILSLVLLFLALPVKSLMVITEHSPLLTTADKVKEFRYGVFPGLFQAGSPFESSCFIMTLLIAVLMGMVAGWTGFAYLQDKKTVDLYHSIPVKRKELYLIKVLICGIDFLGPVLINSAIVLVIASIRGLMTVSLVGNLASMSIGCFVFCLVFYSIAAVSMLLTGKVRYGVLGTLMFQSAPAIMCFLINGLYSVYFETFVAEEETGFFLLGAILSPWMGVASYISLEKNLAEVLL